MHRKKISVNRYTSEASSQSGIREDWFSHSMIEQVKYAQLRHAEVNQEILNPKKCISQSNHGILYGCHYSAPIEWKFFTWKTLNCVVRDHTDFCFSNQRPYCRSQ